ncbi:uncharacterized protein LOC141915166 [Tubulanus polymorphus]|uniref:uncharacterized protein LOC141915166 n=1 Tax=Tubulanus polymorphus TaxID=672921 RepID=UPI003DA408BE
MMDVIRFALNIKGFGVVNAICESNDAYLWIKDNIPTVTAQIKADYPTYHDIPTNEHIFIQVPRDILPRTVNAPSNNRTAVSEVEDKSPSVFNENNERYDWTVVSTRKLLAVIKDNFDDLNAARNKTKVWRKIAEEMNIPSEKCVDKWKNLKKAYRNYVQLNNKTGSKPTKFVFADQMHDIMGDDPSVVQEYVADSFRNEYSCTEEENNNLVNDGDDDGDSNSDGSRKRKILLHQGRSHARKGNLLCLKSLNTWK